MQKVTKVRELLGQKGLDAIWIKSKTMKKWLATMTGSGCQIFITREDEYLILDGRYLAEAKDKEPNLNILLHEQNANAIEYVYMMINIFQKKGYQNLGVEARDISVKEYQALLDAGINVTLLDQEIVSLRMIKDESEIAKLKEVVELTDQIFLKVLSKVRPGMTENELSAWIQYYSISAGAQKMSFDTIVATGERTAYPHGRPTNKIIKEHEPIMIDFGIQYDNYQSDMTRVCFIKKPTPEIKEVYNLVLEAQKKSIESIKTGVLAKDVDSVARNIITDAGYGKYFNHGLGHGLGIGEDGEGPLLNKQSTTILQNNMAMSCEPGVYIPGLGGIRIEDDVVILNGIGMSLNKTTKDYIILD
ncbi:M24 family metallopeptidase [Ligilactobacillus sp. Marseille-Q7487]|uniref:M24 family metallopeptidase n=1 Tax=Ligilactobacillus sp. Marseille-Q7487 TaxID=3022128 RepID=UPI0024A813DA|nr:M24 family metallopeptidase [Ligilactobacillus sp. Marseille-Q7487]